MEDNTLYLSQTKFDALEAERKSLREQTIPEVAKRIDDARQMGDLSENAEYHAAREEMAWAQSRVKEIEFILQNASLITDEKIVSGVAQIGSTVTVEVDGK